MWLHEVAGNLDANELSIIFSSLKCKRKFKIRRNSFCITLGENGKEREKTGV